MNKLQLFMEKFQRLNVSIANIQEHNCNTIQYWIQDQFRKEIIKTTHHHHLELSSSTIPSTTAYKPGGTASIQIGNVTGCKESSGTDSLGCWSCFRLHGSYGTITVISTYRVNKRPTKKIGFTAFHKQEAMQQQQRRTTHQCVAFDQDLTKFICQEQTKEHCTILYYKVIYFLTWWQPPNLLQLVATLQLTDVWHFCFPKYPTISTYTFTTYDLLPALVSITYLPYSTLDLDNRSLVVRFHPKRLFENPMALLSSLQNWKFHTHNVSTVQP